MEVLLALTLGLVLGLVMGTVGGAYFATRLFARALKREMDAGHVDRAAAERIASLKGV